MMPEVLRQHPATVALGGSGRWTVVVGEVEMGDAEIKGSPHHFPRERSVIHVSEIMPKAERDFREFQSAPSRAGVGHVIVTVGGGRIGHEGLVRR